MAAPRLRDLLRALRFYLSEPRLLLAVLLYGMSPVLYWLVRAYEMQGHRLELRLGERTAVLTSDSPKYTVVVSSGPWRVVVLTRYEDDLFN